VALQLWRFVSSQEIAKAEQALLEFPPLQKGGSFNLKAVKLDRKMASSSAQ
jgi:arylsulfatase